VNGFVTGEGRDLLPGCQKHLSYIEAVRQKSSGKMGYFLARTNRTLGVQSEEQRRGQEKCEKQLIQPH
jgi:hypothetical protein